MKYFRSNRRRFRRRRAGVGRNARKYWKKFVPRPIRKYVKAAIGRRIETKDYCTAIAADAAIYEQTNYLGMIAQTFTCIPNISIGSQDGQRVGNQISPVRWVVRGRITPSQVNNTGHFCRIIVYSVKDYNADIMGAALPSIEAQNFFKAGLITTGPNGYMNNDTMLNINKSRITVYYDKCHVIGTNVTPVNNTSGQATGGPTAKPWTQFWVNLSKHCKKLKYDENAVNPNLPINHNCFVTVLYNTIDNTVGSGTTQWAKMTCYSDIHYKDA